MKRVWAWLGENAGQIQALGALLAVVAAVTGGWLVLHQVEAADAQQRRQSAREIYREFVRLSVEKPALAAPDWCAIKASPAITDDAEYANYLQFQLYATEQMLDEMPDWADSLYHGLEPHRALLCEEADWSAETKPVRSLIARFRADRCKGYVSDCP